MRSDEITPPISVLLTPEERWVRAEERWTRQRRRFTRRRAPAPEAPTFAAIPLAVPYQDLTPEERERRATTATPEERALLYPAQHAFAQDMKPTTARGALVLRVLVVLMVGGGLLLCGYGLVTIGTDPNLHDAQGLLIGGGFMVCAAFPFAMGLGAWDEERKRERQGSTNRGRTPR